MSRIAAYAFERHFVILGQLLPSASMRFLIFLAASGLAFSACAKPVERQCLGNLETFDRKILKAGIQYKVWYEINGAQARVRIAGREFDAVVEYGKAWRGPWLQRRADGEYFSCLPEEGGTVKLKFEPDVWFSGNC